jgi:hypothetical protein
MILEQKKRRNQKKNCIIPMMMMKRVRIHILRKGEEYSDYDSFR